MGESLAAATVGLVRTACLLFLKARLDCLTRAFHQFVEGLGLRMAAGQAGYGGDIPALAIVFDDDVEFMHYAVSPVECNVAAHAPA